MHTISAVHEILKNESLDIRVTDFILKLGIHASLGGYQYIRAAVMLACVSPELAEYPTKILYPKIAKYFCTSPVVVERSCRRAIERAYLSGKGGSIAAFFTSRGIKTKPTCKEFILAAADFVREE